MPTSTLDPLRGDVLIAEAQQHRRLRRRRWGAALLLATVAAGSTSWLALHGRSAGQHPSGPAGNRGPLSSATPATATGVFISAPGRPERLCGGEFQSLPPACGEPSVALSGPAVARIPGLIHRGGVTYTAGNVTVVGRLHGNTFDATSVRTAPSPATSAGSTDTDLAAKCPAPKGGWGSPPSQADISAAQAFGHSHPGTFGGLWVGPAQAVLSVAVTGAPAPVDRLLRASIHGALCVTQVPFSLRELLRTQHRLQGEVGASDIDEPGNTVDAYVVALDPPTRAFLAGLPGAEITLVPFVQPL